MKAASWSVLFSVGDVCLIEKIYLLRRFGGIECVMALEASFREIFEHIILDTPLNAVEACCS